MSKMQRTKGATAERELAALIHDHLGVRMVRRLSQTRDGGCDLEPDPEDLGTMAVHLRGYALEVKRAATLKLNPWWAQALDQAGMDRRPVLAYRLDRQPWRFVMRLCDCADGLQDWPEIEYTAEVSLLGWCAIVRERANREAMGR